MFRSSKFEVTEGDPIFEVRYLGSRETERAFGADCTTASVSGLWLRCPYEKSLPKAFLQVGLTGVSLSLNGRIQSHDIRNVSYCCVESSVNDRIFAWIYRQSKTDQNSVKSEDKTKQSLQNLSINSEDDEESNGEAQCLFLEEEKEACIFMCHAVLASKPSRAQMMAATLRRAFQVAYKDWKRVRSKDERTRMVKSLTDRNPTSLPRASQNQLDTSRGASDFSPNVKAETCSLGASGDSGGAQPDRESSSFSGEPSGREVHDERDSWSLSGNE